MQAKQASVQPRGLGRSAGSCFRNVRVMAGARHQPEQANFKISPALLAAVVAMTGGLTAGPMAVPPVASAETEDLSGLSPFERRQRELERRRELLRQAREKAEQAPDVAVELQQKADEEVEDANAQRRAEAEKRAAALRQASVEAYEKQAAKAIKAPVVNPLEDSPLNFSLPPPPEKLSDIKVPDVQGMVDGAKKFEFPSFSKFGMASKEGEKEEEEEEPAAPAPKPKVELPRYEAPKPFERVQLFSTPAPPPAPAPAPTPIAPIPVAVPEPVRKAEAPAAAPVAPKPDPAKVAVKEEPKAAESSSKKRRGPLPLAVAELIVLGMFAGLVAAFTKYNAQTEQALQAASKLAIAGYQKLEEKVAEISK